MGSDIKIDGDFIIATTDGLKGCNFSFEKYSVGATINAILAAVLADGEVNLSNCAKEPEIGDLCNCLN